MVPSADGDRSSTTTGRVTRILGISGSLRVRSTNTELLRAVSLVAPASVQLALFSGLGALPYFNPDLDGPGVRPAPRIVDFRRRVCRADALLICSPEYAHGVPGALKNAIDWLVSSSDAVDKPVGLLNASPRSTHAQASLAETLRTMSLTVVPAASIAVPVSGRGLSAGAMTEDPEVVTALRGVLDALVRAADANRAHRIRRSGEWNFRVGC
jgi:chromate reductase